jgi:hypothetical protein
MVCRSPSLDGVRVCVYSCSTYYKAVRVFITADLLLNLKTTYRVVS